MSHAVKVPHIKELLPPSPLPKDPASAASATAQLYRSSFASAALMCRFCSDSQKRMQFGFSAVRHVFSISSSSSSGSSSSSSNLDISNTGKSHNESSNNGTSHGKVVFPLHRSQLPSSP